MKKQNKPSLETPILFLIFNRQDTTRKVFAEIRKARPKKLFVASDGPRENKSGEREIVQKIRKDVLNNIDWPCEVKTLFRETNFGCKYAVSGAIDWFFENVEQGIILEDDCLPSQSFFNFCQELLEKYKDNEKIMQISGTNVEEISKISKDYFFSPCFNAWGWATWARAWKSYDVEMNDWKRMRFSRNFLEITKRYRLIDKLKSWRLYQLTYMKKINTWDYQWIFCCVKSGGLCVIPRKNLITNMGFDEGTHTTNYRKEHKSLKKYEISTPLNFEKEILLRKEYQKNYSSFFKN